MLFGRGYNHITPSEVKEKVDSGKNDFLILDVRRKDSYSKGHIKGAISAPFNDLIVSKPIELDRDKEIIITCYGGGMSRVASSILAERGFKKVYNLKGGMYEWNLRHASSRRTL